MFNKPISIKPLILPFLAAIILALAGCATDEAVGAEATQPVVQPSPTFESIEVTVVPTPTQSAVTSDDISVSADLSPDQQAVLDIWNAQVEVIRNEEWARLQESCHPGYPDLENRTITQIEDHFTEFVYEFWRVQPSELEFGTPNVQIIGGIQAIVGLEILNSGGSTEPFGIFMTKLEDGKWYDDCAIGGWKSLFLTPSAAGTSGASVEPTPFSTLTDELFIEMKEGIFAQPIVEFPATLMKGSEPLSKEEVLTGWSDYLAGGVFTLFEDTVFWGFCDGGVGTWVVESGSPFLTGAKFDWEIRNDPGASWNSIVVDITMQDRELYPGQINTGIYRSQALTPPGYSGYGKPVYKAADC